MGKTKVKRKIYSTHLKGYMPKNGLTWPIGIPHVTNHPRRDYQVTKALKMLQVPEHKREVQTELASLIQLTTERLKIRGPEVEWKADIEGFLEEFRSHHRLGSRLVPRTLKCLFAAIFVARIRYRKRGLDDENPEQLCSLARHVDAFNKAWCEFAPVALDEKDWAGVTLAKRGEWETETGDKKSMIWLLGLDSRETDPAAEENTAVANTESSST
ncbi:hypothetical protein VTJ49DRAFT_4695 [Mycothermus thermophilus]|uniref:Uncharacterized protein n=1 Tax=Humicola insolens TaxID=85995 RepID=A0ABR3V5D1_HUMIN